MGRFDGIVGNTEKEDLGISAQCPKCHSGDTSVYKGKNHPDEFVVECNNGDCSGGKIMLPGMGSLF